MVGRWPVDVKRDDVVRDGGAAVPEGGGEEFAALVRRHERELRVHCYRMLGSVEEAEDVVQETFLRAWKNLDRFEGRSTVRAWLYRIATNACLDVLGGRARRVLPHDLAPPADPETSGLPPRGEVPWLQPIPDRLLDAAEPDAVVVGRETIELAFLTAIQHLPARQRAALILRDVLGFPARSTADVLETSVASVNSALQRARATMRDRLPPHRLNWTARAELDPEEREVLRRYMDAINRADPAAMADLLAAEVRAMMPPYPAWFQGREAVLATLATSWDPGSPHYVGALKAVPVGSNRQPAAALYVRPPGRADHRPFALGVLTVEDARITEMVAFHEPRLFPLFGLDDRPPAGHR
ncbi:sigma-70 family RNA polymerase sigma factor [Spirillospora sp. NPDC046719]